MEVLRKLRKWKLHDLYSSLYIAEVIKPHPKKMRWVKRLARMERKEMHVEFD
jgi:hypothetical protein